MKIRKFIRAFLAFYRGYDFRQLADWTTDDAKIWSAFLKTGVGIKFKNNLICGSQEQDRLATLSPRAEWACGAATGYRLALLKIDEFSVVPAETGDEYETIADIPARNRFEQNNR